MRYLILGNGYIGNYLLKRLPGAEMEMNTIKCKKSVKEALKDVDPRATIINCIGKTGRPNIDWCEDNVAETIKANIMVPQWIAEVCQKRKQHWIHVGSACIYDGYERPWSEMDEPNFFGSVYSKTKSLSQQALEEYRYALILRIRMPIDEDMHERCYISKLLKYIEEGRTLFNEKNSMTYLPDLVNVIKTLAAVRATGTYNVVNPGPMTAEEVLKIYDPNVRPAILPKEVVEQNLKAKRSNCVISAERLESLGIILPDLATRIRELKARIS